MRIGFLGHNPYTEPLARAFAAFPGVTLPGPDRFAIATVPTALSASLIEQCAALVLCLPPHLQAQEAKAALEADLHVLCGLPPATSVASARAMANRAHACDRLLMYAAPWNHAQGGREGVPEPSQHYHRVEVTVARKTAPIADAIAGVLPEPNLMFNDAGAGTDPFDDAGEEREDAAVELTVARRVLQPLMQQRQARERQAQPAGALLLLGADALALGYHLLGEPQPLFAEATGLAAVQTQQQFAHAGEALQSGPDSIFRGTVHLAGERQVSIFVSIAADADDTSVKVDSSKEQPLTLTDHSYARVAEDFLDLAVLGNDAEWAACAQGGVTIMAMIDGLYQSARLGRPVKIAL